MQEIIIMKNIPTSPSERLISEVSIRQGTSSHNHTTSYKRKRNNAFFSSVNNDTCDDSIFYCAFHKHIDFILDWVYFGRIDPENIPSSFPYDYSHNICSLSDDRALQIECIIKTLTTIAETKILPQTKPSKNASYGYNNKRGISVKHKGERPEHYLKDKKVCFRSFILSFGYSLKRCYLNQNTAQIKLEDIFTFSLFRLLNSNQDSNRNRTADGNANVRKPNKRLKEEGSGEDHSSNPINFADGASDRDDRSFQIIQLFMIAYPDISFSFPSIQSPLDSKTRKYHNGSHQNTLLHLAILNHQHSQKLVKFLVDFDLQHSFFHEKVLCSNLLQRNKAGELPIHIAISIGSPTEIIQHLVEGTILSIQKQHQSQASTPCYLNEISIREFFCFQRNNLDMNVFDLSWIQRLDPNLRHKHLYDASVSQQSCRDIDSGTCGKHSKIYIDNKCQQLIFFLDKAVDQIKSKQTERMIHHTNEATVVTASSHRNKEVIPTDSYLSLEDITNAVLGSFWKTSVLLLRAAYHNKVSDPLPKQKKWRVLHAAATCAATVATHSSMYCYSSYVLLKILEIALLLQPGQIKEYDEEGKLPLHHAVIAIASSSSGYLKQNQRNKSGTSSGIDKYNHDCIDILISNFPPAVMMKTKKSKQLPLHLVLQTDKSMLGNKTQGKNCPMITYPGHSNTLSTHKHCHPPAHKLGKVADARTNTEDSTTNDTCLHPSTNTFRSENYGKGQLDDNTIMKILRAHPEALDIRDPVTNLYPFMQAATNEFASLEIVFQLLKMSPTRVIPDK